jgi:hypothetical protein
MFAQFLPWISLFGLLSILGTVFKLFFLPKIKGRRGETNINSWIQWLLGRPVFHLVPDV